MPWYMQFGSIQGTVKTKGFSNWIALTNVSFGVSRPSSFEAGKGMEGRHKDLADVSAIRISKDVDIASTALMRNCIGANPNPEVNMVLVEQGEGSDVTEVARIKLSDVLLSEYSCSLLDNGGFEGMSLTYAFFEWEYKNTDAKGKTTPNRASYDVLTATPGN